jgi:hypothetical protein
MNIPDKGYDSIAESDWSSIMIYTSPNGNNEKTRKIKLPFWLSSAILIAIGNAKREGAQEVRMPIRSALGL